MLPPTELSVFGQSNWQTDYPLQEQETIVSQVEATQVEGGVASFAHISASGTQATPLAFSEDVLELSDVLTSDLAGISNDTVVSSLNSLSSDVPLLAVLGSSPTNQEIPSNPFETTFTPQPANTGGAYDLAVGQVTSPTNPQLNTDSIVQQDVSLGAVNKFDGITAQQIPEALIEEIVNRVVQRLSTNAIQEIAWEVVPEMAELLIRKQISQQKQLAH